MSDFGIMDALQVTAVSMFLVFLLLAFLMGVIMLQSYLIKTLGSSKKNKEIETVKPDVVHKEEIVEEVSNDEELEVVAAIMAALSTYIDVPQEKLVIKSIKRLNSNNKSWGNSL